MKTTSILIAALVLTLATPLLAQEENPAPPLYSVSALLQKTNKPFGGEIVLEGFPTAVCKRNGRKAWLRDTNAGAAGTIRVERTGAMPAFRQDVVGKTIRVTGTLRELRMDAAYFDSWEARVRGRMNAHNTQNTQAGAARRGCAEECLENAGAERTLQIIAARREKLAASPKGYLSALWVDGRKWELVEAKAVQ